MNLYIKTEHGELLTSFVQSFSSFEEFEKADILTGHSNRKEVLKKAWSECNPVIKETPKNPKKKTEII
jgi:hypothetical protein